MHTAPEPLLREYPRTDPRLGRKLHLDARSLPYVRTAADPRTLRSVHWPRQLPILGQGQVGACVLFTEVGILGSSPLVSFPSISRAVPDVEDATDLALDLYEVTTAEDPFDGAWRRDGSGEDTGTDGLSAAKVLKRKGLISSFLHATNLAQLITLLQDGPVAMGMPWHEAFFDPQPDGRIDPRGWADTQVAGGHEVEIVGVELADNGILEHAVFTCANSWTEDWGLGGYFKMGAFTYSLLRADIDLIQLRS
jgi:hypothetical protein